MLSTSAAPTSQNCCVNCAVRFHRNSPKQLLSETSEDVRQLVCVWISREITQQDAVCGKCFEILQESIQTSQTTRKFGHRNICIPCGSSILRAHQMHSVHIDSAERSIILQSIPSHQVECIEHVCMACWMKASRAVSRHRQQDDNRAVMIQQFEIEDSSNVPQSPLEPRFAKLTISRTSSTITGMCLIIAMILLLPVTVFFGNVNIHKNL